MQLYLMEALAQGKTKEQRRPQWFGYADAVKAAEYSETQRALQQTQEESRNQKRKAAATRAA